MLIAKLRDVGHATSVVVTQRLQDAYVLAKDVYSREKQTLVRLAGSGVAAPAATRFLVLRDGAVYFQGTENEFVRSPDPYVRKFLA